jgi:hypothetical protein
LIILSALLRASDVLYPNSAPLRDVSLLALLLCLSTILPWALDWIIFFKQAGGEGADLVQISLDHFQVIVYRGEITPPPRPKKMTSLLNV